MKKRALFAGLVAAATALGVWIAVVGLPGSSTDYSAFAHTYDIGQGPEFHLEIDAVEDSADTFCDPVDTASTAYTGTSQSVAVCAWDIPGAIGAFSFDVVYDSDLNECPEVTDAGTALDDNPDANAGTTTFGIGDDLGSGWDCSGYGYAYPSCDANDQLTPPIKAARLGCLSTAGPHTLGDDEDVGVLGVVDFNTVGAGLDDLILMNVVVGDPQGAEYGSCNPSVTTAIPCFGADITKELVPTPTPTDTPPPPPTPTNTPTPLPGVRMEKDANVLEEGVQTTNNLWLMEECVNAEEGKGCLEIDKLLFEAYDADSPNDLDDIPEGLGAWEEQIKFDHKIVSISPDPNEALLESEGRIANCTHTVLTENWFLVGCTTKDDPQEEGIQLGPDPVNGGILETITVSPLVDDLKYRMRPSKDNGVLTDIIDENCEIADIYGEVYGGTLPGGLTVTCGDVHITVRILEGDLDLDCDVDVADDQMIAFRYGALFGDIIYDSWFDLEPFPPAQPDFDIDIKDLQYVFGRNYSTCQAPIPDNQLPANPVQ